MDELTRPGRCVRCGADLPGDSTEGLCPACLMAAALSGLSSEAPGDATTVISGSRDRTWRGSTRLTAGQAFGPYLIGRLLGRGGMGEVYEAEHVATGRRVALKVLNQQLAGPEERARFLREGQLAASVNHPHAVYIFGSEDIGGIPVISMELVPGGTLKDRVEQHGPLAPSQAVDAILDVIAGLDAAHAGGILHRDVKPSNCFVDARGSVKVGDFGLSISTLARDVSELTRTGTFQGTPQYAALEQLRGQPLDVRADIYAVGATLYYLLTGGPPFDDRDLATLVARIASEPPASPRLAQQAVPQGLAVVVLRCLAKDRSARYGSYAELDDALRPFSSERPTPATPGLRFVAGLVDKVVLTLLTVPLALSPQVGLLPPASITLGVTGILPDAAAAPLFARTMAYALTLAYYVLLEGLGDASLGKRLCGLRVSRGGTKPGLWRAFLRAVIFTAPFFWPLLLSKAMEAGGGAVGGIALIVMNNAAGWILFTSMRRRNGYAGWHDLASGTRVVASRRLERPAALEIAGARPARDARLPRRVGPYDVTGALGPTAEGELAEGFDPALRRRVWLHILRPDAPPMAPALRDLDRPGRLRWLNGRRLADDAWDAFEAPDGAPLLEVAATRQPWSIVRSWLVDLARELEAAERDGTTPPLALDRVWITKGSRALLLDVSIVGAAASPAVSASVPRLLASVATVALEDEPLPLSARAFLTSCERESPPLRVDDLVARVNALALEPVRVTSWRRGVAIGLTNLPALVAALAMLASAPFVFRVARPDFFLPFNCLVQISKLEAAPDADAVGRRRAFDMYCSATYGATYADQEFWNDTRTRSLLAPLRSIGERVRADYPAVSPSEAARAASDAGAAMTEERAASTVRNGLWFLAAIPAGAWFLSAMVCLASAMLLRGGLLMRLLGIAVVNSSGERVSRIHGVWRGVVAWSPVLAFWGVFRVARIFGHNLEGSTGGFLLVLVVIVVMIGGAVRVLRRPSAGWHDRVCGTRIVPR